MTDPSPEESYLAEIESLKTTFQGLHNCGLMQATWDKIAGLKLAAENDSGFTARPNITHLDIEIVSAALRIALDAIGGDEEVPPVENPTSPPNGGEPSLN